MNLDKLNFTVLGAARSGFSCAKLLKKFGAQVFVTEEKKLSPEIEKSLQELHISYEDNGHSVEKILHQTDFLIISPGILLSSSLIIKAKQKNILVVSEVEVASWFFPENLVCFGITGTNGKSTTTNYLASLLQLNSLAVACGNIGKSVSEALLDLFENNFKNDQIYYFSIELSSYQLEAIYSLRPLCTCFLNLQNDHLARYENMNEYLKAKWRLILLTRDDGLAIIEKNVLKLALDLGLSIPKCEVLIVESDCLSQTSLALTVNSKLSQHLKNGISLPISIYKDLKDLSIEHHLSPFSIQKAQVQYKANSNSAIIKFINKSKNYEWHIKDSCLRGLHNIINILTASLMAEFAKTPSHFIFAQWEKITSKYIHLPHRLEQIGKENQICIDANKTRKKITIINDSKATNVESTLVALKAFSKPIRLLLGGEGKGDSYSLISQQKYKNLIMIYPFGQAAPLISHELSHCKKVLSQNFSTMLAAAEQALIDCNDDDIILLSPACSSFDEFKNYEHRGNIFRAWALSCCEENNS